MKTLLAIDGNSILNRAFYGVRPLATKSGLFTHAVFGMINIIDAQIKAVSPDMIAAAFDLKAPTFRHKMYDGYKATRKGMPPELAQQLPYAKSVLDAMGVTVLEKEGYEADDILGTLSAMACEDLHVYILTGDRDSLQLITPYTTVLLASTGETVRYDRDVFFEKYGIEPPELVDAKALMGDSSDNIPGVPGIGEKTALKLIAEYKSIDKLYENIDNAPVGPSAREKLAQGKDSAYMSLELARICKEVPLGLKAEDLIGKQRDEGKLYDLFTELEFFAFIKRYSLTEQKGEAKAAAFEIINELPNCKNKLFSLYFADRIYLYDGKDGYAYDGECEGGFFEENEFILSDVKAAYYKNDKLNAVFDTSVAAYLINSADGDYSPEKLIKRYLSSPAEAAEEETEKTVSNNHTVVCRGLYELQNVLAQRIEDEGVSSLYYDTEFPLCRVLYEMERTGFTVDTVGLRSFGDELNKTLDAIKERVYMMCGEEFNINSPKQLGHILFEVLHLPAQKKTKTGYSTNAEVLEKLRPYSPVIGEILEYRAISKLIGTYVDGMLKVCDDGGVVHTSFNQTVTATGRLSSTEPNLQNIPIRTETGRQLRRFFIAGSEGRTLVDADYSQIELRLLAAISGDKTMLDAFENGIDIHALTASQVFGVPVGSVTKEMRKRAKAVNFGIVYGIGAYSLSQDIGVSVKAAGQYINSYLSKYPAVSKYLEDIKKQAKRDGYVKTLLGRRRYIPELFSPKKPEQAFGERVAMNSPIQGTAADIIKIAMVNTNRALKESGLDAKLILQVHDELIVETDKSCVEEVKALLVREMENAVKLKVKLSVEATDGDSWYKCK